MAYYRLHHIKGSSFFKFDEFKADDDVEAVQKAQPFVGIFPAELWCGERKVMIFNPVKP